MMLDERLHPDCRRTWLSPLTVRATAGGGHLPAVLGLLLLLLLVHKARDEHDVEEQEDRAAHRHAHDQDQRDLSLAVQHLADHQFVARGPI